MLACTACLNKALPRCSAIDCARHQHASQAGSPDYRPRRRRRDAVDHPKADRGKPAAPRGLARLARLGGRSLGARPTESGVLTTHSSCACAPFEASYSEHLGLREADGGSAREEACVVRAVEWDLAPSC